MVKITTGTSEGQSNDIQFNIQCPQYEVINTGIIYYFTVKFVIGIRPAYYPPTIYSFVFVHFLLK